MFIINGDGIFSKEVPVSVEENSLSLGIVIAIGLLSNN